jgi:DMSO/TMAO reductase YedYZ molybdopterin-dependent catalytic subunit
MRRAAIRRGLAAAMLAGLLAPAAPAVAQNSAPPGLAIEGRVEHPRTLALTDLTALPPATVQVEHTHGQDAQKETFTGALLWPLLTAAGPVDEPGKRTFLQHTVLARGQDGYAVALAIGELDPNFEGKQVLIAYAQDGKPLPGLRLVVPADTRGGRSVHDLVAIEVR